MAILTSDSQPAVIGGSPQIELKFFPESDVRLKQMNEEQFPEELINAMRSTIDKYKALGWQDVEVGWPTTSNESTSTVFIHATGPTGERLHAVFTDDGNLAANIESFFES